MKKGRVCVSSGFLVMLALLIYIDGGALFWAAVLAAALHELGHYAAMRALGCRLQALRLTACGAEMELSSARTVPYVHELIITLCGPLTNLFLALLCANLPLSSEMQYLFAGVNISLGLFNLLPIYPMDGGNCLQILLVISFGDVRGRALAHGVSWMISLLLLLLGIIAFAFHHAQISLCVTAFWLFARNAAT